MFVAAAINKSFLNCYPFFLDNGSSYYFYLVMTAMPSIFTLYLRKINNTSGVGNREL